MTDVEGGEAESFVSTGEQLKRAREAKGLSLDDVANQTRIPIRHLQAIEREEWDALPAPTYAVGFARNYANAVGLDGAEVGLELRERLGGQVRSPAPMPEYYEPADPSRMPPKGLVIGAVVFAALLIAGYFFWFSSYRSEQAPELEIPAEGPQTAPGQPAAPPPAAANGPVTLTATGEVWLRVTDGPGGPQLFSGNLNAGQAWSVPATAQRPLIRTSRPQLLRASVGGRDLGPLEPVERAIGDVSLLPNDLSARIQANSAPALAPAPAQRPAASRAPAAEPPPLSMPPPELAPPGNTQ